MPITWTIFTDSKNGSAVGTHAGRNGSAAFSVTDESELTFFPEENKGCIVSLGKFDNLGAALIAAELHNEKVVGN